MAYISDTALDAGLQVLITNVNALYITSAEATTYAEASTTYKLGTKSSFSLASGNPQNGATNGRRILTPAITDGTVDANGTAAYWALTSGTVLYATGQLNATQAVTSGNTFTLAAFSITLPDAV
jgi:hypothetical protein